MNYLDEDKLKNSSEKFRVNDVAAFLGITPRILKHYEDTEVISPERSQQNDYREYSIEDIVKIQTAEKLKLSQFSQREIAGYFTGEIDLKRKFEDLVGLRKTIDDAIALLDIELNVGKPQFSVEEEGALQCFCKTYTLTDGNPLRQYLNSRDTYISAIKAGCTIDVVHTFFLEYRNLFPIGKSSDEAASPTPSLLPACAAEKTGGGYRICIPILSAKNGDGFGGTVENVTWKKSFTMKYSGHLIYGGQIYYMLQEEAIKRGLTLTGKVRTISETGSNRKTAEHTYTIILSAEIE